MFHQTTFLIFWALAGFQGLYGAEESKAPSTPPRRGLFRVGVSLDLSLLAEALPGVASPPPAPRGSQPAECFFVPRSAQAEVAANGGPHMDDESAGAGLAEQIPSTGSPVAVAAPGPGVCTFCLKPMPQVSPSCVVSASLIVRRSDREEGSLLDGQDPYRRGYYGGIRSLEDEERENPPARRRGASRSRSPKQLKDLIGSRDRDYSWRY